MYAAALFRFPDEPNEVWSFGLTWREKYDGLTLAEQQRCEEDRGQRKRREQVSSDETNANLITEGSS